MLVPDWGTDHLETYYYMRRTIPLGFTHLFRGHYVRYSRYYGCDTIMFDEHLQSTPTSLYNVPMARVVVDGLAHDSLSLHQCVIISDDIDVMVDVVPGSGGLRNRITMVGPCAHAERCVGGSNQGVVKKDVDVSQFEVLERMSSIWGAMIAGTLKLRF